MLFVLPPVAGSSRGWESELVGVVDSAAVAGSSRGWQSELVGVVDSAAVARTSWDCECELVGVVAYSVDVFGSSKGA